MHTQTFDHAISTDQLPAAVDCGVTLYHFLSLEQGWHIEHRKTILKPLLQAFAYCYVSDVCFVDCVIHISA